MDQSTTLTCGSPSCGHELGGPVAFCPFCGAEQRSRTAERPPPPPPPPTPPSIPAQPAPPPPPPPPPQPEDENDETHPPEAAEPGSRSPRALWLLPVAAAVLAVWFFLPSRRAVDGTLAVVLATPAQGTVLVDGTPHGQPGHTIQLSPGQHSVGLQSDGWNVATQTVSIAPGRASRVLLRPLPSPVALTVTSEPDGATLTIDDAPAGIAPATLSLPPGNHRIRAALAGHVPVTRLVLIHPGQELTVGLILRAAPPRPVTLFATRARWSNPVMLPSGSSFRLAFSGRLRLRVGGQVFLLENGPSFDLGLVDAGPLQVKAAQAAPFDVSVLLGSPMAAPAIVPAGATPGREGDATRFFQEFFVRWSGANDEALDYIQTVLADPVDFYGKTTRRQAVMATERAFAERWPDRHYSARPGSVHGSCGGTLCHVDGIVDWLAISEARNARSIGASTVALAIDYGSGTPRIVGESGHVTSRGH